MEAESTFMQIAARYAGLLLLIAVAWAYLWPVLRAILVAFLPDHLCGPGGRVIDTVHDEERRKSRNARGNSASIGGMFVWFGKDPKR